MTRETRLRIMWILLIAIAAASLIYFVRFTEAGHHWTNQENIRAFLDGHPTIAPIVFVLVYVAMACMFLPLWWVQGVAGYCFGAVEAIVLCQLGNTIGAFLTVLLAERLTRGMSMKKIEPVLARLHHFQERLGSTGIPLVMGVRLVHFVPFGPANIAFGLMKLRPRDVAIGTLIGNTGSVAFYAILGSLGADTSEAWSHAWKVTVGLLILNVILLAPLVIKYVRSKPRDLSKDKDTGEAPVPH